jgi:hypothetical protein
VDFGRQIVKPFVCLTAALALAIPAALAAQDQAKVPDQPTSAEQDATQTGKPDILVEGEKHPRKAIKAYIRSTVAEETAGQYAKFDAPVCPSFTGFNEELSVFLEQRMRDVAKAADIPTGKKNCRTNVHVAIVENGPEAIANLRQRRKGAFGRMRPYERDRIAKQPGPVYSWHIVSPMAMDGNQDRATSGAGLSNALAALGGGGGPNGILDDARINTARTNSKSRVLQPVRQSINHAVVLIEKDAILGLSPAQIADYVTLRALARAETDESETPRVASIRTLFDGSPEDAPEVLTEWDLALLTALYAAPADLRASQQRAAMAVTFEKVLAEQGS